MKTLSEKIYLARRNAIRDFRDGQPADPKRHNYRVLSSLWTAYSNEYARQERINKHNTNEVAQ